MGLPVDEKTYYTAIGAAVPTLLAGLGWVIVRIHEHFKNRRELVQTAPRRTITIIDRPGKWCNWHYNPFSGRESDRRMCVLAKVQVYVTNLTKADVHLLHAYVVELKKSADVSMLPRDFESKLGDDEWRKQHDSNKVPPGETYIAQVDFKLDSGLPGPAEKRRFTIILTDQYGNKHRFRRLFVPSERSGSYKGQLSASDVLAPCKVSTVTVGRWRKRTVRRISGRLQFKNEGSVVGIVELRFSAPAKSCMPTVTTGDGQEPTTRSIPQKKSGTVWFETELTGEASKTDITLIDHLHNEYVFKDVPVT